MELDPRILRERIGQAAFISNTSVAFPMALGFLVALPLYRVLAPDVRYVPFALFMGVAMSITAFPVLARILIERRMLKTPGRRAVDGRSRDRRRHGLGSARARDRGRAASASGLHALWVIVLAAAFTAAMILIGRPLLGRVSRAYDEVGPGPDALARRSSSSPSCSPPTSPSQIGIAAIFGAFLVGLIMPRHAGLTEDVTRPVRGLRRRSCSCRSSSSSPA